MKSKIFALLVLCLAPLIVQAKPIAQDQLQALAPTMSEAVAKRSIDAIYCAEEDGQQVDKIIVVDMSLRSTQKRLWAFDFSRDEPRLVLNDRVAHGSGSDRNNDGFADTFSNTPNSNMTSLGLYKISESYQGRNGLSRRLDGLFKRFNSQARERAVVMHSSAYVNSDNVGRSQGCPAVDPKTMAALEKVGLKNAVLWMDAPDSELTKELVACAAKHEQRSHEAQMEVIRNVFPTNTTGVLAFNWSISPTLTDVAIVEPNYSDLNFNRESLGFHERSLTSFETSPTQFPHSNIDERLCTRGGWDELTNMCTVDPFNPPSNAISLVRFPQDDYMRISSS